MKDSGLPSLYLIDAYSLIYRSYFAFLNRPLRNSAGKNVSVLFNFARTIVSFLDDGAPAAGSDGRQKNQLEKPKRLAAIFDSKTSTFRHKMYPEYKATRQKTPEDLYEQVLLVEEFLSSLGIPNLRVDGFEADDIIATLVMKCKNEKRQCYILSSDKDLLQLVGGGTYEIQSSKNPKTDTEANNPGSVWDLLGPDEVKAEWDVEPEKFLDLLSLTGDPSDNISGVKGIGSKTAAKLIIKYGSLDNIYKNIAAIEGAVGKKLSEGKESAYFSQSLIRLRDDVPLPVKSIDELSIEKLNRTAGAVILFREGIRQSAKQLDPDVKAVFNTGLQSAQKAGSGGLPETADTKQKSEEINSKDFSNTEPKILDSGVYKIILDLNELKSILEEAVKQKLLVLDFETDSLDAWNSKPVGISLALKPQEAFYVPLVPHGGGREFNDPEKVRALLSPIFADKEMLIAAHNAKFDYKVSRGWGIDRWQCKIWDTMVAAWLSDPERNNYSLDSLAFYTFDYTPVSYSDIVQKGCSFESIPLETAANYSCEDADLCIRLKNHLEPLLIKTEAINLFENLEMPLLPILAEMEGEGIHIESKVLTDYGKELAVELEKIQSDTWKIVGHEFNLSSPKQLQEVLFVERKLTPGKKTKTGYSTDAEALVELARVDPVPALILRHRTLSKLKSNYIDTLADMADSQGRLHTNFNQTGTATGRLSSREPNLQNIPIRAEEGRRIREAFTAKPGYMLISADYSQIELVVLAHLSEDENLVSAFNESRDIHARTASLIFGIDECEVKSEQRRIAKTINFGVIYGMSAFRLANELNISRSDAAKFISAYFNTYSGVKRLIEIIIKKAEETGFITTIFGRRRYIPTINSRNRTEKAAAERIAVNTPIQGSAADIVKTAMLNLDRRLSAEKSRARLLLQVHDELVLECPEEDTGQTASLIKTEMEQAVKLSVPLHVSIETGQRWINR
jgi:DNA polymerase-1